MKKTSALIAALAFVWWPAVGAVASTHPSRSGARHRANGSVGRPVASSRASFRAASFRLPVGTTRSSTTSASKSLATSRKKKALRKKHTASRTPLQKAPTPDRISEIQSALSRGGYYQNGPNGKWDGDTVSALQKFQSANGLEPTGKLDALSLQKMGLGSEIAGVSAPRPIVHPAPVAVGVAPPASATGSGTTPPQP